MLLDFRTLESGSPINCDICIIGAGAAGITLACSLIDSGIRVCLLESGGLEHSPDIQDLYDGERVGLANADPLTCRLRRFGGTTNHWMGWCAPLRNIDFEPRPWIPHSGWPIRRADLDPYYEKAGDICQIGSFGYETGEHLDEEHQLPSFSPEKADIRFFRFSPPTRFGLVYREKLSKADNVNVILYANTLRLETNEAATEVRAVHLRSLEGKTGTVSARIVVLACGGMENARLLLLSNQVESGGLGNRSGLVGRYFMQHIEGNVADVLVTNPDELAKFEKYTKQGVGVRAEISLSERAQQKHGILNSGFTLSPGARRGPGPRTLRKIWEDLKHGHWPHDFSGKLRTVLSDLGSFGDTLYKKDNSIASLRVRAEQLPDKDSRISLGDEMDAFGIPRIKVNWRLTQFDKHSIIQSTHRIAEELGRLNLGRLKLADWILQEDNSWPQPLWGGCHHMGTTRMSDDKASGVVDRNCRMHTVGNLYVAGSSVFPTAGYVPPTLTIVALALRLADHLRGHFHGPRAL